MGFDLKSYVVTSDCQSESNGDPPYDPGERTQSSIAHQGLLERWRPFFFSRRRDLSRRVKLDNGSGSLFKFGLPLYEGPKLPVMTVALSRIMILL